MNYQVTTEELSTIYALREEFGPSFILLSYAAWELLPAGKRCESWNELSTRLVQWATRTGMSRAGVAALWMQLWCRELLAAPDPNGLLARSLDCTLAVLQSRPANVL